eukprot:m.104330 g.104330  ORF g.104330 m.104330 type:complete len:880 (-) comp18882_c0_seq1:22-2661(-)
MLKQSNSKPWLLGSVRKENADQALAKLNKQGAFLVRSRPDPKEHVLSLLFNGKPTHHLLREEDDGLYTVNGKQYGECRTVKEVIEMLKSPVEGWPVCLTEHVSQEELDSVSETSVVELIDDDGACPAIGEFLHGSMTREEAEKLLMSFGRREGQFLVRIHPEDNSNYMVEVVNEHNVVIRREASRDDQAAADGSDKAPPRRVSVCEGFNSVRSTRRTSLMTLQEDEVSNSSSRRSSLTSDVLYADSEPSVSTPERTRRSTIMGFDGAAAAAPSTSPRSSRAASGLRLLQSTTRVSSFDTMSTPVPYYEEPNQYVLSVVYRGRPTHHKLQRRFPGEFFSVNGKVLEHCTTLEKVVKLLCQKHSFWPVALSEGIPSLPNPTDLLALAQQHVANGAFKESVEVFTQAIESMERHRMLVPKNVTDTTSIHELAQALEARAVVHARMENYDLALQDCEEAIRIEPEYWMRHYTRGSVLKDMRNFSEARRSYQQARFLVPIESTKQAVVANAEKELRELELDYDTARAQEAQDKKAEYAQQLAASVTSGIPVDVDFAWFFCHCCEVCDKRMPGLSSCAHCHASFFCSKHVEQASVHNVKCQDAAASASGKTFRPRHLTDTEMQELVRSVCLWGQKQLLPKGRLRVAQQRDFGTWRQWLSYRVGVPMSTPASSKQQEVMSLFSFVLTTVACLQMLGLKGAKDIVRVHHVQLSNNDEPTTQLAQALANTVNPCLWTELCAVLPSVKSFFYAQIDPDTRGPCVKLFDDVLPAAEEAPLQRLTVVNYKGPYRSACTAVCAALPNIILVSGLPSEDDALLYSQMAQAKKCPVVFVLDCLVHAEAVKAFLVTQDLIPCQEIPLLNPFALEESAYSSAKYQHLVGLLPRESA